MRRTSRRENTKVKAKVEVKIKDKAEVKVEVKIKDKAKAKVEVKENVKNFRANIFDKNKGLWGQKV